MGRHLQKAKNPVYSIYSLANVKEWLILLIFRIFLSLRSVATKSLPWLITIVALSVAFRGVDWGVLADHLGSADISWITAAVSLTILSYLLRARRWQHLFHSRTLDFLSSARVLILGFFMNNILPARAGELVRAHLGARVTGETRTLVLASIASERLADGLTISLMFVLFSLHLGDARLSENLFYVALMFALVSMGVVLTLFFRTSLFALAERCAQRFNRPSIRYLASRARIFIEGLSPLFTPAKIPMLILWSILIWMIELGVFFMVSRAYGAELSLPICVLFLVAVNFSSLIPSAPGGIGVIEAIASTVLVSIGITKELALTMVLTQHAIQYFVVGVPGAVILFSWQSYIKQMKESAGEEDIGSAGPAGVSGAGNGG